eukprot:CAMPEP_0168415874 /NCGR_PEP_ID=MMETSP0228-20121227/30456_1 /TAXON_ID=133427 /ORGANISM="Protoceratium reticulatum, Strain CCCM 535 (=CCMP 1889)" /LENGTH=861 /DNA_ID=CAMNT_0008429695 /DNA_START=195 /DNA_END=2780 /DNA_ORIENTATION=+
MPTHMTYRAVGSSTGQYEFVGEFNPAGAFTPYNDFGSGDIPMSASNFAKVPRPMVHIPFTMGAIAIFHSVPSSATGGRDIHLTGCVLAKIFSRQITTWDHSEIRALNPSMSMPANTNIKVVHRVLGSSSTSGTTTYLNKNCPAHWSLGAGSTISWPADTFAAQGSGNVAKFIQDNSYAIGYLDAGHGHSLNFGEIALQNNASTYLTSRQADIGAAGAVALAATPPVIPADPTADWSGVDLYDLPGTNTWPITMFSYFYVQKNVSSMDRDNACLLKAFIEFTLSPEGQAMLQAFSFTNVAQQILDYNAATLRNMTFTSSGTCRLIFENATSTRAGVGAEGSTISGKRRSYGEYERSVLATKVAALETKVSTLTASAASASRVAELHGSGTTNPSKYFWKALSLLKERSKMPLHMTYRAVGSSTGQYEFVGEFNPVGAFKPYNHFGSGDIPMSAANFAKLTRPMVHIPFVMGAIAIFHSVPSSGNSSTDIHLTGCVLAKIFSRQITNWDHSDIMALNPQLSVPANTQIKVVRRVLGSSSTAGTTSYLQRNCPGSWSLGSGSTITWPAGTFEAQGSGNVADFIRANTYAIGYLDAGHGHAQGFSEIALRNSHGTYLTSRQADIGNAGTVALAATPPVIPTDPSVDWSGVNLYDLAGNSTWPITMFSYFYVQNDLSAVSPATAGLLKAFIEFTLSAEGQAMLESFAFTGVPQQVLDYNNATVGGMTWPAGMPTFQFETAADTRGGVGAELHTLSGKRRSYGEYQRGSSAGKIAALEQQVAALSAQVAARPPHRPPPAPPRSPITTTEEKDDGVAIAAILVSCVAILFSTVASCFAMRASRTVCFKPFDPQGGSNGEGGMPIGAAA